MCSNVEIEKAICAGNTRAHNEREITKDGKSRLLWSDGISRPIPRSERSERSIQVKIARKIQTAQRQKKNLDGLYEIPAPGSTVGKISSTTSVSKNQTGRKLASAIPILQNLRLGKKERLHWSSILKGDLKSTGENS